MSMSPSQQNNAIKVASSVNRFLGLWHLMNGYHISYLGASASLAIAALAKTSTYLLLRYFADNILGLSSSIQQLALIGLGFIFLAGLEGCFTYLSGRLAAYTAENVTLRLRNYLYDHIQRLPFSYHDKTQTGELIQRSTSDVDALRRFYAEQAIGIGRIFLLFTINFFLQACHQSL